MIHVHAVEDSEALAEKAAGLAAESLHIALESQTQTVFVMAGGRLPPLAAKILSERYADELDWRRIVYLIGDERCVAWDDPQSSWRGLSPLFTAHPEIPAEHQLRPRGDLPASEAATHYSEALASLPLDATGVPVLHHLWLGIGEDGHTLSLFPDHTSSLLAEDTDHLVIPVYDAPKPPPERISLSYKALQGVESAIVFISGGSKAPILAQIANGDHSLPVVVASQIISEAGGQVTWLIDHEALGSDENSDKNADQSEPPTLTKLRQSLLRLVA